MSSLATVKIDQVEARLTENGWESDEQWLATELNFVASLQDESMPPSADPYAWAVQQSVEIMQAEIVKKYLIEARQTRTY